MSVCVILLFIVLLNSGCGCVMSVMLCGVVLFLCMVLGRLIVILIWLIGFVISDFCV